MKEPMGVYKSVYQNLDFFMIFIQILTMREIFTLLITKFSQFLIIFHFAFQCGQRFVWTNKPVTAQGKGLGGLWLPLLGNSGL